MLSNARKKKPLRLMPERLEKTFGVREFWSRSRLVFLLFLGFLLGCHERSSVDVSLDLPAWARANMETLHVVAQFPMAHDIAAGLSRSQ
jgi:hypothetical protein